MTPAEDEDRLALAYSEDTVTDDGTDDETPPAAHAFAERRATLLADLAALDDEETRSHLYPRWVYHATDPARVVATAEDRAALGDGWENRPIDPDAPPDVPVVLALEPDTAAIGVPSFTLSVRGTGFAADSVIVFNGYDEPTTVVSPTEVTTGVNMDVWTAPSLPLPVAVRTAAGVLSNALSFTFTAPAL